MTLRATILGLLGAIFIVTVGYFSSQVANLAHFANQFFPIVVFFPLVMLGAANPLLNRIGSRWRLSGGELSVVAAIMLIGCSLLGTGLLRFWSRGTFMPVLINHGNVRWNKAQAMQQVPSYLLVNDGRYSEGIADAYRGLGKGSDAPNISFSDVPWWQWRGPLATWMPIILLYSIASICMALMVRRQWAENERLPYPIAAVAAAFMGTDENPAPGGLFRNHLFIIGAIVVFGIHLVNGLNTWTNGRFIEIPMVYNFFEFLQKYPTLNSGVWGFGLVHVALWPTIIAFACFINENVSFSLGISAIPFLLVGVLCTESGINLNWSYLDGGVLGWQMAGSFLAVGVTILYLGRRYYSRLLGRVFGIGQPGEVRSHEAWAGRVFLICYALLVLIMTKMGLDWPFAVIAVGLFMLGFLVFARINVESGLVLITSWWQPMAVLVGLFGAESLGLQNLAMIGIFYPVLSFDRRDCLMPMILNGLRICRYNKVLAGRVGAISVLSLLAIAAVAVPFGLWVDYNWGFKMGNTPKEASTIANPPSGTFEYVAQSYNDLRGRGQLLNSRNMSVLDRLTHMKPDPKFLWSMGLGFGAVLLLAWLRMRLPWWPLHPILLLVWGTGPMQEMAYSFLLGWLIKRLGLKYGLSWQSLRLFMIGVIAGDLAGGALWMIAGAVSYGITGQQPAKYFIFPL
ncbi:MAG: hypothetical protein LLG01_02395 [Planctomycetaceae bacterium]|nr:hypothetical protein [Planctomycetaceae bacterium]